MLKREFTKTIGLQCCNLSFITSILFRINIVHLSSFSLIFLNRYFSFISFLYRNDKVDYNITFNNIDVKINTFSFPLAENKVVECCYDKTQFTTTLKDSSVAKIEKF